MELYFKDLISKESTLEKLVDDLALVVQGADDFAKAVGENVSEQSREELHRRLHGLKARCRQLGGQAAASARATDRLVRHYPYSFVTVSLAIGMLLGIKIFGRK